MSARSSPSLPTTWASCCVPCSPRRSWPRSATTGPSGWDSYSWAFTAKHSVVLFIVHNPGVSDDEACGPLIDSFAIKTLQPPQRTKEWGLRGGPVDEDDYSSLFPWTILSTTKSVKYIDAAHYA
uniref:DUF642 domain-containing protein n=1 Tax=Oryza rufipogon TaxID=4529 RepID=A0A0E0MY52_ORYRU